MLLPGAEPTEISHICKKQYKKNNNKQTSIITEK